MRLSIPLKTVSGANAREHHMARARRVKKEREAVMWMTNGKTPPAVPCIVTLTRVGPTSGLDLDNLQSSQKAVRDQIAQWLGIDDRDLRVTWKYDQRREKAWGVEVVVDNVCMSA